MDDIAAAGNSPGSAVETGNPVTQTDVFVRRWEGGDRYCLPQQPGILVTTPYPGLRSFRPDLNRFFCGREKQKGDLKQFFSERHSDASGRSGRITFVVGGSGSGKSSLTRAGLIAELNSIPIKGQWGAWYVAEMRPEKNPVVQLHAALCRLLQGFVDMAFDEFDQRASEVKGDFPERTVSEKARSALETAQRIRAAAGGLGIEWPEGIDKQAAGEAARQWLEREISPGGHEISALSLFDFVDGGLAAFDAAASSGVQRGRPLLLLHVDQFEEVFRNECDAAARDALIQLVRDVHGHRPERLFAVATMRSEELHRFSEYPGMSEVINSSMYLVDLVAGDEIESVIVDPAMRLTRLWEIPLDKSTASRFAPYAEEAVKSLSDAYWQAGDAAQHKADRLPLLQHALPLVWAKAVSEWIERRQSHGDARFEIGKQHLELIPGWKPDRTRKSRSVLERCLDATADRVLRRARTAFVSSSAPQSSIQAHRLEAEVDGILTVAFTSLAQLDDNDRPVRRFISVDDMLRASGGASRLGWRDAADEEAVTATEELRFRLSAALRKFEKAGMIEVLPAQETGKLPLYNVTHESLIRNWSKYAEWLGEHSRIVDSLYNAAHSIREAYRIRDLKPREQYSWKWLNRLRSRFGWKWQNIERAEDAARSIPRVSANDLAMIFEPVAPYSLDWARGIVGDNAAEVSVVRDAWEDATWYHLFGEARQIYYKRTRRIVASLAALALTIILAGLWQYMLLNERLKLALQVNEARRLDRTAVHDRMFDWVVERANTEYRGSYLEALLNYLGKPFDYLGVPFSEQRSLLRQTIANIDDSARQIYGNEMMIQFSRPDAGQRVTQLSEAPALCTEVNGEHKVLLRKEGPGKSPVSWQTVGPVDPNSSPNTGFVDGLNRGLLCASGDGRWLLQLDAEKRFAEIRRLNASGAFVFPSLSRRTVSSESQRADTQLRAGEFGDFYGRLTGQTPVSTVYGEAVVGFWIPQSVTPRSGDESAVADGGSPGVLLWTTTGFADPDDAMRPRENWSDLSRCNYQPEIPRGLNQSAVELTAEEARQTLLKCETGPFDLGADQKKIVIFREQKKVRGCGEQEEVLDNGVQCQSTIEIQYADQDGDQSNPALRSRLVHFGAMIEFAEIVDDKWLWLADEKGKQWRYVVGTEPLKNMIALRWREVKWSAEDSRYGTEYLIPAQCKQDEECAAYIDEPDERAWRGSPKDESGASR